MDESAERKRLEWYRIRDELARGLGAMGKDLQVATLCWLVHERDVLQESIGRLDRNAIPLGDGCREGWSKELHEYLNSEEGKEALEDLRERFTEWNAVFKRMQEASLRWLKQEREQTTRAIEQLESYVETEA